MSDLYELTRKLVGRGCEEHPRLVYFDKPGGVVFTDLTTGKSTTHAAKSRWSLMPELGALVPAQPIDDSAARDLWTMHVLRWAATKHKVCISFFELDGELHHDVTVDGQYMHAKGTPLASIEAATRHLEPASAP